MPYQLNLALVQTIRAQNYIPADTEIDGVCPTFNKFLEVDMRSFEKNRSGSPDLFFLNSSLDALFIIATQLEFIRIKNLPASYFKFFSDAFENISNRKITHLLIFDANTNEYSPIYLKVPPILQRKIISVIPNKAAAASPPPITIKNDDRMDIITGEISTIASTILDDSPEMELSPISPRYSRSSTNSMRVATPSPVASPPPMEVIAAPTSDLKDQLFEIEKKRFDAKDRIYHLQIKLADEKIHYHQNIKKTLNVLTRGILNRLDRPLVPMLECHPAFAERRRIEFLEDQEKFKLDLKALATQNDSNHHYVNELSFQINNKVQALESELSTLNFQYNVTSMNFFQPASVIDLTDDNTTVSLKPFTL